MMVPMFDRLKARPEWKFFGVLLKADCPLAMGALVGAVQRGSPLGTPLFAVGTVFVLLQITPPFHHAVGANLGSRTAAWLYDQLTIACVTPPGMGHLEDERLTTDLAMARDFDLGISGPPLSISMDFIASGLVEMIGGLLSAIVLAAYAWWAPLLLAGAWLATHWLLRESAVWRDRNTPEVRAAQRHADYAYRLAVDPPAAKELRLFGLADWVIEEFRSRRRHLFELRWQATRLRERRGEHEHDRVRRTVVGARRCRGARRRGVAPPRIHGLGGRAGAGRATGRGDARTRDPLPPRHVRLPHVGRVGARGFRSGDSGRLVARHRGAKRRRQDDHREALVPAVRPPGRRYRSRRRGPPHPGIGCVAVAADRGIPGLRPLRAVVARQRRSGRRSGRRDRAGPHGGRCHRPRRSRHGARPRLPRRDGPVGRPVATDRAGAGAVRRAARRRLGAARRADGPARRTRRGPNLRPHPRRYAARHDDPHLPPLLDGAPRRSHLRAGARQSGRAGHTRRADRSGGPLSHDVRAAGVAVRRRRRAGSEPRCPRLTTCLPPCPPCGARSSAATRRRRCS